MSDIEIKKGDTWVNKLDETNTVTLATVGAFSVTGSSSKDGSYMASRHDFLHYFKPSEQGRKDDSTKPKAVELLETSAATLIRCGKKYDSTGNNSERVMDRIVDMFNAATGHELSEAQGNIFMVCLKVVRSETSTYHDDDHYIDGVNYFAMAGEAASEAADD